VIIPRPTHNDYLLPYVEERAVPTGDQSRHSAWVKWYLDAPTWKCPKCGCIISGRSANCVFCRLQHRIITPRPEGMKCMTDAEIDEWITKNSHPQS